MNTTTVPAGRALGLKTLRTLDALAEEHRLEPPQHLIILSDLPWPMVKLQMAAGDHASVDAWARVLGLPPAVELSISAGMVAAFISYESRAEAVERRPVWLGWLTVEVWCEAGDTGRSA